MLGESDLFRSLIDLVMSRIDHNLSHSSYLLRLVRSCVSGGLKELIKYLFCGLAFSKASCRKCQNLDTRQSTSPYIVLFLRRVGIFTWVKVFMINF